MGAVDSAVGSCVVTRPVARHLWFACWLRWAHSVPTGTTLSGRSLAPRWPLESRRTAAGRRWTSARDGAGAKAKMTGSALARFTPERFRSDRRWPRRAMVRTTASNASLLSDRPQQRGTANHLLTPTVAVRAYGAQKPVLRCRRAVPSIRIVRMVNRCI